MCNTSACYLGAQHLFGRLHDCGSRVWQHVQYVASEHRTASGLLLFCEEVRLLVQHDSPRFAKLSQNVTQVSGLQQQHVDPCVACRDAWQKRCPGITQGLPFNDCKL